MGTYTEINTIPLPTGLDEIGIHLGLPRLDKESLSNYQRRLILETRERSGPTEKEFISSLSRRIGQFDTPVFRISLTLSNGIPLAVDPYIEITSSYLRAYSNRGANLLDFEINLYDRDNGYFLRDIYSEFFASTYFDIEIIDEDYVYKISSKLRFSNTEEHVPSEAVYPSTQIKLNNNNLISFYPDNRLVYINEKDDLNQVLIEGDYYVDYVNGVVFSYIPQAGIVSYTYMKFPFTIYWQSVRCYPYNDNDKKVFHKDALISDSTGEEEYVILNKLGNDTINSVLGVHPIHWGK